MVKDIPGVTSALAERLTGGRYIDIDVDRAGCRALRDEHLGRAGHRLGGDRRREHRRDRRGAAALPHQRPLSARAARLGREAARPCPSSRSAAHRSLSARSLRSQSSTARRC